MKKRNVIVVGLLSLSLLSGCTTNKIERSEQDIKQEKVEKAKKEIASENKREKASSTKLIIPNSNEITQTESTQTENKQTEPIVTPNETQPHQYDNCGTCESCVAETKRLEEQYNKQTIEETNNTDNTANQQGYPIAFAPTWFRECNSKGHTVNQGLDTQTGKYCWVCIDCNKDVGYEKCNEHNTPATPEHMQLHLN